MRRGSPAADPGGAAPPAPGNRTGGSTAGTAGSDRLWCHMRHSVYSRGARTTASAFAGELQMPYPGPGNERGFTLIELMITLIIAAVVLAFGVPSFESFIRKGRLTSETNNLIADLQFARSEAIKRGIRVTVCHSADQASCGGTAGIFDSGWIVFVDRGDEGIVDAGTDEILRVSTGLPSISSRAIGTVPAAATDLVRIVVGAVDGASLNQQWIAFVPNGMSSQMRSMGIVLCSKARASDAIGESTNAVPRQVLRVSGTGNVRSGTHQERNDIDTGSACEVPA